MTLIEFINFATYSGLFDYVSLVNYPEIEQWIKQEDPEQCQIVIDEFHLAWPVENYIKECKRKQKIEDIISSSALIPVVIVTDTGNLKQLIKEAAARGDFTEVMKLKLKQLEKLKNV